MTSLVWAANLLGWPFIHLSVASVALRLPARYFAQDNWITAPRRWEREGRFYRDWLRIRAWKSSLPDGATWFGGFTKKTIRSRDARYMEQFLVETRRAELAHFCMLLCAPLFFLWNPLWARGVMLAYAVAANLPCILAQRYNRIALYRVIRTRRRHIECL